MKRHKKILKWTGITLGALVVILLAINTWFVRTTDTRLERQLAEIRAAGDPISLAELARPPIPPEKNAATYLHRAEADTEAIYIELGNVHSVGGYPPTAMSTADRDAIKAIFDAYPKVMPLLEQAAACPDYDAELDYAVSPQEFNEQLLHVATTFRPAYLALNARALGLASEGDRDEAVRTALLAFQLARHFDHNPTLICYLVALAARGGAVESANAALQTGPVSQDVKNALDAELAIQERMDGYAWMIKSERVHGIDYAKSLPGRNSWLLQRGFWNRTDSAYLEVMQGFLALPITASSYPQALRSIYVIEYNTPHHDPWWHMMEQCVPAIQSTYEAVTRTRAMIRCLRVLNALQTHVPADSDELPKLTALGLPADATTDPYNGEPLHVKKTPRGWLVYSVGRDLKDDGGKVDDGNTDIGVGPPPTEANPAEKVQ